jgi:hypothetical protein
MSVVRVEGVCNGSQVIFTSTDDGNWNAEVPAIPTGTYVVSVTAYDEAGNSAYRALMLFSVDVSKLEIKVVPLHFSWSQADGQFGVIQKRNDYAFAVMEESCGYRVQPLHFKAVVNA